MMQEDSNGESTFEFVEKKKGPPPHPLSLVPLTPESRLENPGNPQNPPKSFSPPPAPPPTAEVELEGAVPNFPTRGAASGSNPQNPVSDGSNSSNKPGRLSEWFGGGILSKVAEKAQSSVQSVITTLDPQMREFIYSGGDIDIVVASDKEAKISPVREGFQTAFGKATVRGVAAQAPTMAAQPVGFVAATKGAEERIQSLRCSGDLEGNQAIVSIEGFLVEITQDSWFESSALVLSDPSQNVTLQVYTQMTPVPLEWVTEAQQETPDDYPLRWAGLGVTIGEIAAKKLQVPHWQWHEALTGVTRRDMILIAAKTLAGLYKNALLV